MAPPFPKFFLGLTAGLLLPASLAAQRSDRLPSGGPGFLFDMPRTSIGVRGGFNLRRAGSGPDGFFGFVTRELTLSRRDFDAFSVAADLDVVFDGPADVVFSAGYSKSAASSEFRDWVDQNDQPITQRTTLSTNPLTVAVRVNLASRGRQIGQFAWIPARVLPYVGLGAGVMKYTVAQDGYFVDSRDLSIFRDRLSSKGWAGLVMGMAGIDYSLGKRLFASAEARLFWANAELRQDFVDFDDGLDLSGIHFALGLHYRI
jgi:hypothetical protein